MTISTLRSDQRQNEAAASGGQPVGSSAKTFVLRVIGYLTNHVISHVPSYRLRHVWYRKVLGLSIDRGAGVHLGCFMWFNAPGQVRQKRSRIGVRSRINRSCCLDLRGPLWIGDDVSISPEVMILTGEHRHDQADFAFVTRPVVIEDHVWIGSRAVILPGTTLGRGAVVAAGAVVSGSVAPMTVVGGVPARPISTRPEHSLGYRLDDPFPLFE
jgi:maltose O-acetyltransferase